MDSLEENKAIARRYLQAWATRDIAEFEALLAPGFVDYMMGTPRTRAELLKDARNDALRDIRQEMEAMLADENMVAVKYTTTAVHTASSRPLKFTGMFILRIADGKVTGGWGEFDRFGIRQQLGDTPAQKTPVAQYPRRSGLAAGSLDDRKALCLRYLQA